MAGVRTVATPWARCVLCHTPQDKVVNLLVASQPN
jgi:hypothetical protein